MAELLHDYADATAASTPGATALVMDDERLTYADVAIRGDRLAAALADAGCRPGDRIGLLAPKSPAAIVAMHGALKAGCVYVPLDAESPSARLARIVSSAEPAVVLAVPEAAERLDGLAEEIAVPPVWSLDFAPVAGERVTSERARGDWDVDAAAPGVRVAPDAPAHLLFTSGSTGQPKGVIITHAMVTAFVDWAVGYFGTKASDRVSGHPPLHFDLSTFDIYATFSAGAELHLVPPSASVDPRTLPRLIRGAELTQWFSVPSVLTYMAKFDVVEQDDFPSLDRLMWCGEVLPTPVLAHWMRKLPHVEFTNLYGPTEATIASSYYTVPELPADESVPVPIGYACEGEELLVLDEELAELPAGEIGDLFIGGVGLSPGYWRDEEKTAAAFIADPRPGHDGERIYRTGDLARVDEDGAFHFLGRADSQIKSRGYRIELGEIESALNTVEGVRECAVVGVEADGFEGVSICAAYVGDVAPPVLRRALTESLPSYMLPARWLALDVLPKNQNGKIDRPDLRRQFAEQQAQRRAARG